MVLTWSGMFAAVGCALFSLMAAAQTPELTVVARSPRDLQVVLSSVGVYGESFGLGGPTDFLKGYEQHLDGNQPLTAACAFSTEVPMFAAEFVIVDSTQWWSALSEDGLTLDSKTGELANASGSLKFFVEQSGNKIRISDNREYLKAIRLPVAPNFAGATNESAVVMHVDWRNLRPEVRSALATQVLGMLLPQSQTMGSEVSLANLPAVLSSAATARMSAWFSRSESMDLRFQVDNHQRVQLAVDVVNRSFNSNALPPSPFAGNSQEDAIAQGQWNLPIEFEFRNYIQALAAQLNGDVNGLFAGDKVEGNEGRDTLQAGTRMLARHALELVALQNLQGTFTASERDGHPVLAAGLRVANPAKLDADLQKLLKAAADDGAPFKLMLNQPNNFDANLHRIEVPIAAELKDARELFGEVAIINVATTPHAVLIGVGEGSEEKMAKLVTVSGNPGGSLLSASVASDRPLGTKLGLVPAALSVQPIAQGFRIFAAMPEAPTQSGRLTGTAQ